MVIGSRCHTHRLLIITLKLIVKPSSSSQVISKSKLAIGKPLTLRTKYVPGNEWWTSQINIPIDNLEWILVVLRFTYSEDKISRKVPFLSL